MQGIQASVLHLLSGVEHLGILGGLAFVGLYVVATIAFIPGSILTLGAGAVFGLFFGFVYVFLGATLGATAAFLLGRYLVRDRLTRRLGDNGEFRAIDRAIAQDGFKVVLLTRLSPIFPFNLLNYALGVTGVSLRDYVLASIGMIPGTLLYVYLGSLVGDLSRLGTTTPVANPALQWSLRLVGLAATITVTVLVTRIARRALSSQKLHSEEPVE